MTTWEPENLENIEEFMDSDGNVFVEKFKSSKECEILYRRYLEQTDVNVSRKVFMSLIVSDEGIEELYDMAQARDYEYQEPDDVDGGKSMERSL